MTVANIQLKNMDFVKVNGVVGYAIKKSENVFGFYSGKGGYSPSSLPTIEDFSVPTNEEKVQHLKSIFVWGTIKHVYQFGANSEYLVFEYQDYHDKSQTVFHLYRHFKDISRGAYSFDKALLTLLEYKYQGLNSQAAEGCARLLEIDRHVPSVESDRLVKVNGVVGFSIKKSNGTFGFWDGRSIYSTDDLETITTFEQPSNEEKIEFFKMRITLYNNSVSSKKILNVHVLHDNYEYVIFEYEQTNENKVYFQTMLNFDESFARCYYSFDSAVLGLLNRKYQDLNSQMDMLCERILEIPQLTQ